MYMLEGRSFAMRFWSTNVLLSLCRRDHHACPVLGLSLAEAKTFPRKITNHVIDPSL